jgi:hypothetical protein
MTTVARPTTSDSAHFYTKDGQPMHFVERSDGKGLRPATLRDARKLGLLPSPTSILKVLRAPQLESWLTEQACLAVLTAPRKEGEDLDAFVERVLHTERQQDEQARKARDLGTEIHAGIAAVLSGKPCLLAEHEPFVMPAIEAMKVFGDVMLTEKVVVGDRCAGRLDAIFNDGTTRTVVDLKTATNPPLKGSWLEHKLQLSMYAAAIAFPDIPVELRTANVYIGTRAPGIVVVDVHADWRHTYERGFKPLLDFWMFANNYDPAQP